MSHPNSGTWNRCRLIRNATVINGRGKPPFSPADIRIEEDTFSEMHVISRAGQRGSCGGRMPLPS